MTGKCIKVFDEAKDCVSRITLISHEGSNRLVASSWDGCIRQYDLNNDALINTMAGHSAKIKSIMAVNYRILISGADDHELRIWNLKTGSCLYRLKIDKPITSMCMGENNHILYCANKSGTIRKYQIPRTPKSEQYLENVDSQEEQTHYSTYETSLL
jgi:WD40 repeat protein